MKRALPKSRKKITKQTDKTKTNKNSKAFSFGQSKVLLKCMVVSFVFFKHIGTNGSSLPLFKCIVLS